MTTLAPSIGQSSIFDGGEALIGNEYSTVLNPSPCFSKVIVEQNTEPETADQAIERATDNANEEWKSAALDTIVAIAQKQAALTSDDVLAVLELLEAKTHDTRALGGIFVQASRMRWIRKSGNYKPSNRKENHRRPILIWESLLFPPQQ